MTHTFKTGDIYSFRCAPSEGYSQINAHRYSVIKVLDDNADNEGLPCVAVLDGLFDAPPTFKQVYTLGILHQNYGNFQDTPAVIRIIAPDQNTPAELTHLGTITPKPPGLRGLFHKGVIEDYRLLDKYKTAGMWPSITFKMDLEWRWRHDRDALKHDQEAAEARRQEILRKEKERYTTRLRGLTLETLQKETPFATWDQDPVTLPKVFITKARAKIQDTIQELQALGERPRKPAVRKILKACAEWFNAADAKHGGIIETLERDDICDVFEELAHITKQKALYEELEDWREW